MTQATDKKERKGFYFNIDQDLHREMKIYAAENELSMREIVTSALEQYMEQVKK